MLAFASRVALLLSVCLAGPAAQAASGLLPAPIPCGPAIAAAEDVARVPSGLLQAIGRVESGRIDPMSGHLQAWPWTINAEGQGAFYATKADAIAAVRALQARGVRSIDVGCMQVNLMFHPAAFASLDDAFDPRVNARYAAQFLTSLRAAGGDWIAAVGAYHSQTESLGADYRRRVLAAWHNPGASYQVGLAVAYHDFSARSETYADFAPSSSVYGAFAGAGDARNVNR